MTSPALVLLLAIFTLSNVAFLVRASAAPWIAFGLSALLVACVVGLFRRARLAPLGWRWGVGIVVAALALCIVGGGGHLMFTTEDWQVRDAVLHDLMRPTWPVLYGAGAGRQILRAPLGFFLLPAALGQAFGLAAAHLAVLAQNTVVLAATLLLWAREFRTTRTRIAGVSAILLFSGWDVVGQGTMALGTLVHGTPLVAGLHIERWGGLEYSSFLTDLFWAPNHGLPALAFAGLYFAWKRGEIDGPALALFAGLSLLWSPLAVMGMSPFVAYALLTELRAGKLDWRRFAIGAVAGAAVLPVLLFEQLDSGSVVHGFLFSEPDFPLAYLLLLGFEVAPMLYLLLRSGFGQSGANRAELALVIGMLLLIPIYRIGPSDDFVMRASVAPLALAGVFVARRLADSLEQDRRFAVKAIVGVLAIGAVTPALQVVRAFVHPASAPVTLPVPQAWAASVFRNAPMETYFASPASLGRYAVLLKPAPAEPAALARQP